jgi:hypothetical protein
MIFKKLWDWLALHKTGRAFLVLGLLGAGVWAVFTFFFKPDTSAPSNGITNVNASGSVVANNISNSTISVGTAPDKKPSIIRSKLSGAWGENHCDKVSYRISVDGPALVMESLGRPPGTKPYRFVGTILSDEDNEMQIRGEEPDQAYGASTTLSYRTNGVTERLEWTDHGVGHTPIILNRCRQKRA